MPMNETIRRRRKELGMTQEAMAAYLGVTAPAVNKWEKGNTAPDVGLLPALARLLGIDMNALFSFHDSLTEKELNLFSNQVSEVLRREGLQAGVALAEEKMREYPNCHALCHRAAVIIDGATLMLAASEEEKNALWPKLLQWYERAAGSEDETIRNAARFMLASKYLAAHDTEKAQEMIDTLPERNAMDKRALEVDCLLLREKAEEAAALNQRRLWNAVNELQMVLMKQVSLELSANVPENARRVADKIHQFVQTFDLWAYNRWVAPLEIAVAAQDVKESLACLKNMLESMRMTWTLQDSPLYGRVLPEPLRQTGETFLPAILQELKSGGNYAFLWAEPEFQTLLEQYQKSKPLVNE